MLKIEKIPILLLLFLSFSSISVGQARPDVLIYSNKSDFLVPYIKTTLQELKHVKNEQPLLGDIKILNTLFSSADADKLMRSAFDYYSPRSYTTTDRITKLNDSISDYFANNDLFLLVNQNLLQDNIEFQLVLFEILTDTDSLRQQDIFPFKNIIRPIAENNFFVRLGDPAYLDELKNGVKKLFPQTNYKPEFKLQIRGNLYQTSPATYRSSIHDSIFIRISHFYDQDNSMDQVKFTAHIFQEYSRAPSKRYSFSNEGKENYCGIQFASAAKYRLVVEADDGASISFSDTVYIEVIEVPKIIALNDKIDLVYSAGVFNPNNISFVVPVFVDPPTTETDFSTKFDFNLKKLALYSRKSFVLDSLYSLHGDLSAIVRGGKARKNSGELLKTKVLQKTIKLKHNIYKVKISTDEFFLDTSLNIFMNYDGPIISNIEKIRIKQTVIYPINFKSGFRSSNVTFERKDCNCGDSTLTYSYVDLSIIEGRFNLISKKSLGVGPFFSFGKILGPSNSNNDTNVIKRFQGFYDRIGLTFSYLSAHKTMMLEYYFDLFSQSFPVDYNPRSSYFNPKVRVRTIGYGFGVGYLPVRLGGLGVFFNGTWIGSTQRKMKFTGGGLGAGITYRPTRAKK